MSNEACNLVFISHKDKTKIKDLYDRISDEEIFAFILPPPVELYGEEMLQDKQQNILLFGADSLRTWKIKNWNTHLEPYMYEDRCKISRNGDYLSLRFDTRLWPPVGIYDELVRQGYNVRAYYWELGDCICGSYINGELEHIKYLEDEVDIPMDIDCYFPVSECRFIENYEGQLDWLKSIELDNGIDGPPDTPPDCSIL